MIFLKGMRRLDRVGNIGMKVPITKIGMTHEGVEKIVEDLKKAEGIGEAPYQTLGVSPFEKLIQYLGVYMLGTKLEMPKEVIQERLKIP